MALNDYYQGFARGWLMGFAMGFAIAVTGVAVIHMLFF